MKFIHCADLHLDSKIETLPSEKTKIRREEILRTFERLSDFAGDNSVSAVIIAGDMFDTSKVSNKTKLRIFNAIKSNENVDFLYLSGNHDEEFMLDSDNVPSNLKFFGDEWTEFNYGNVLVSGIKLNKNNSSSAFDTLNLPQNKFNIVTMHGQVAGYKSKEDAEVISIPKLKDKNVDYLALGHIHGYSSGRIDERGVYAYSGCLDGRGFDETGNKGFILVDVDENSKAKYEFVNFSSRNFYDVEFVVSGYDDWFKLREEIIQNLKSNYDKNSLIKVILKGEHAPDFDIDKEGLSSRLNEEFFFAKVYDKTELKVNVEDFALDKSVRGEFVRAVWESDLSNEEKSRVIMCGINALKGEEI
ncbi:MAG: exonuclease SbcCD subunit D [Clostridiales bacterium]|nr:exonuclease SbcCD subunit D [Clostridiales bacterium]